MAKIEFTRRALLDLERLAEFLREAEPAAASRTAALVNEAIRILENHPSIGRPVENELRELVISRGRSGYLALYSHESEDDAVLVLAIRHQREAGYFDS